MGGRRVARRRRGEGGDQRRSRGRTMKVLSILSFRDCLIDFLLSVCWMETSNNRAPQRLQGVPGGAGLNPGDTELAAVIACWFAPLAVLFS